MRTTGGAPLRYAAYFPRSVTTQVLSAGLAEFSKEMEAAPVNLFQHSVQGTIRPKIGLNDRVQCPMGSRNDWSGRCEHYPSDQSIELDQVRGIVLFGDPTHPRIVVTKGTSGSGPRPDGRDGGA